MTKKILVLDAAQRSALAVTRSLGKLEDIEVMTADSGQRALAGYSTFSHHYFVSPNPTDEPEDYITWLLTVCGAHDFALVIPVTEITSQLLLMNMSRLPQVKLPFSSYGDVMRIADKGNLIELANTLAIQAPKSTWLPNSTLLNLDTLEYPCVIKPCLSKIFTNNKWISTNVVIIYNKAELDNALADQTYLKEFPFMIQEFIPGHGAGVFCLFNRGQPTVFFAHRRIREKPPQGGVSVLSESAPLDPNLKLAAENLLRGVAWHGVAMVEFRVGDDGKAYLMEVNTRFWGSLQLAIDAGVDFPALLVSNELNLGLTAPTTYKIGQRLRWLLGDLDGLYIYLKSNYTKTQKLLRIVQFLTPSFFGTKHEINRIRDLKPAIFELKQYAKQFLGN
jgi:predicted ATP-grasp superfamily ATP-dependent carboligase